MDEAHFLKNNLAKRTEILIPILRLCTRVIMLTGTPALANPKELFPILSVLKPEVFNNFEEFAGRYCDPKPSQRIFG